MNFGERLKLYTYIILASIVLTLVGTLAFAGERTYTCDRITKIRDGDTFECMLQIDPFFKIYQDVAIRIADVNCPETRGWNKEKGFKSKEYLKTILDHFGPAEVRNIQKWSFDRVVADVYLKDQSVKDLLISNGGCKAAE